MRLFFRVVLLGFLSFLGTSTLFSQPPTGYYDPANGLSGAALQTALHNIIDDHTSISYDGLWTAFQTTDDNASGKVWDMYSNCTFTFGTNQCGNYANECDCYNREHSFPKSWFGGVVTPMYSDLFHLVPTDGKVNGIRDNYAYGEVGAATYTSSNGSKLGTCNYPGYTGIVFEPIDEYKGDFARNHFYMAVRYADLIANWHSNDANAEAVLVTTAYPAFESWYLQMLMDWHYADPVSQKETDRNNTVYTSYQHNRNPFIDDPGYAALIWPGYAPYAAEPTNHAAGFSAHCITLNWADATGIVTPTGYLVRMSSTGFGGIVTPGDTNPVADDFSNKNVAFGVGQCIFGGLTPNSLYYFKIFGYTGSGANIDYKTDGTIQQVSLLAK
jgi:endonuclease I